MLTPFATAEEYFGALTPGHPVGMVVEDDDAGLVTGRVVAVEETRGSYSLVCFS
jgi:hypothetical protein